MPLRLTRLKTVSHPVEVVEATVVVTVEATVMEMATTTIATSNLAEVVVVDVVDVEATPGTTTRTPPWTTNGEYRRVQKRVSWNEGHKSAAGKITRAIVTTDIFLCHPT